MTQHPQGKLVVAGTLAAGVVLSLSLHSALQRRDEQAVRQQVRTEGNERVELLSSSAARALEALHALSAYLELSSPSREDFRRFVAPSLKRLPEVQAFEWVPRVTAGQRPHYEQAARRDGIADFGFTEIGPEGRLVLAAERPEYFPVFFAEPTTSNRPALGLDVATDAVRASALADARATGQMVASGPIRLAQEPRTGQLGFLVFAPVHGRGEELTGFALSVFRVETLARAALSSLPTQDFRVSVSSAERGEPVYEAGAAADTLELRYAHEASVDIAGRRFEMRFTPSAKFVRQRQQMATLGYPLGLLAASVALSAYFRRSQRHQAQADEANRRLQAEVSIRKRAQEQAASARQAQSRFLASMSHEIRTPLNAIVGYCQILHRDDDRAPPPEATRIMLESSHHLLNLVDDVLDLSKIEAGHISLHPVDFNLGSLVSNLRFLFQRKCQNKGLTLAIDGLSHGACWVRGDEGKLRQVLINLMGNAVKFTRSGGVKLGLAAEASRVFRFEVIDTGPGIPVSTLPKLFDVFYQGPDAEAGRGTGLGLAISRQLVEVMGGKLQVESRVGSGTRFSFGLQFETPVAVAATETQAYSPRLRLAAGQVCRCLVVDNLEVNRNVLCHLLESVGCEAHGVESGERALAVARELLPHVVFMDVLMPDMDGFEATRRLGEDSRVERPRVVAFSASALETQRAAYLQAGFDGFLPKPFRLEQLSECLSTLLGLSFAPEESPPHSSSSAAPELAPDALPDPMRREISEAARLHEMTRLRALLEQLASVGPGEARLARRLQGFAAAYDMHAIVTLLPATEVQA